jgi:hypothetical protein
VVRNETVRAFAEAQATWETGQRRDSVQPEKVLRQFDDARRTA